MLFVGAELGPNPIPLPDWIVFTTSFPKSSHVAQNVREKWSNRIDLELLDGLQLGLACLAAERRVRVGPDMLFQRIYWILR
jgi:hypothetical protein